MSGSSSNNTSLPSSQDTWNWLKSVLSPDASPLGNPSGAIWSADNPIGTETTASMRPASSNFQPAASVGGQPVSQNFANLYNDAKTNALGWVGTFGGPKARTFDQGAADWASAMEARGASPTDIHQATGFSRGTDGQWRFEIPDNGAKLQGPGVAPNNYNPELSAIQTKPSEGMYLKDRDTNGNLQLNPNFNGYKPGGYKLSDVLDHPELYKAYPELANIDVQPTTLGQTLQGTIGSFDRSTNTLRLGSGRPEDMLGTALHETQHGIQDTEGFAQGGNVAQFLPPGHDTFKVDLAAKRAELEQKLSPLGYDVHDAIGAATAPSFNPKAASELQTKGMLPQIQDYIQHEKLVNDAESNAFDQYNRLAGETEARNVTARAQLNPYERATIPPAATQKIPREEQLLPGPNGTTVSPEPLRVPTSELSTPEGRGRLLDLRGQGYTPGDHEPGTLVFNAPQGVSEARRIPPLPSEAGLGAPPPARARSIPQNAADTSIQVEGLKTTPTAKFIGTPYNDQGFTHLHSLDNGYSISQNPSYAGKRGGDVSHALISPQGNPVLYGWHTSDLLRRGFDEGEIPSIYKKETQ